MNQRKGYVFVMLAASLWATDGAIVKLLYNYQFDSTSLAFLRAAIAFVIALIVAIITRPAALRISLKHVPFFASYALIGISLFTVLYYQAFSLTTVATAVVLLYTSPIFVILLARVIYREPLTSRKIAALILAIVGCALVVGLYQPGSLLVNAMGVLFGLGAGFTYALYGIYGKKASSDYSPLTVCIYNMGFGALFLLPLRPLSIVAIPSSPPIAWLLLLALGVLPSLLPFTLYPAGLRYIEVGRASLVATVQPVVSTLIAFVVLAETPEPLQILGALLVISAALLAQAAPQRKVVLAEGLGEI